MTVAAAFQLLELSENATLRDVSVSFRRLLKVYHPDRNSDRREWSHQQTVLLNEAYEAATHYLRTARVTTPLDGDRVARGDGPVREDGVEPDGSYDRSNSSAGAQSDTNSTAYTGTDPLYSVTFQMQLATLYDMLLDQVFAYYSFGLNNIHLRTEGTFRYRFRMIMKHLKNVVESFQELRQWSGSELQRHHAEVLHRFATGFYENLLIKPHRHQVLAGDEHKAYLLYRQGAKSLDDAIQIRLFQGQLKKRTSITERSTSERSFMTILADYPRTEYIAETLIKLYLLESFKRLCTVLDQAG